MCMSIKCLGYNCHVEFGTYENGNTAMMLIDSEDYSPVATATINPDKKLDVETVAIKNYSENEGITQSLLDGGVIVGEPLETIQTGFVEIEVYKLSPESIKGLL